MKRESRGHRLGVSVRCYFFLRPPLLTPFSSPFHHYRSSAFFVVLCSPSAPFVLLWTGATHVILSHLGYPVCTFNRHPQRTSHQSARHTFVPPMVINATNPTRFAPLPEISLRNNLYNRSRRHQSYPNHPRPSTSLSPQDDPGAVPPRQNPFSWEARTR